MEYRVKKTLVASLCLSFLLLAIASASASAAETPSVFAEPPRAVAPSPSVEAEWRVPPSSKVVDFEASPSGGEVALLVSAKAGGAGRVLLWTPGREPVEAWSGGATVLKSVTWHPSGRALFLLATEGGEHRILRLDGPEGAGTAWKPNVIHRSKAPLRRLVAGPRPFFFDAPQGDARKFLTRYRLFFGVAAGGGAWALHSVTEEGTREYQVAGPKATRTRLNTGDPMEAAASYETASALPLSFHPAGHVLLWEDGKKAFQAAHYEALNWGETKPLWGGTVSGGTVTALPNGRGVLHWTPGKAGAAALARGGREATPLAAERTFVTTPSLFPDGKAPSA